MKNILFFFSLLFIISCDIDSNIDNVVEIENIQNKSICITTTTTLNECTVDFELSNIVTSSIWFTSNNTSNFNTIYVDYLLETIISSNWRYNLRMTKRGEPTMIGQGYVEFIYSGVLM